MHAFCVPFAFLYYFFCCSVSYLRVLDKGFCLIRQTKTCPLVCFPLLSVLGVWWKWFGYSEDVNISVVEQPLGRASRTACVRLFIAVWAFDQGCYGSRGLVQTGLFLSFACFSSSVCYQAFVWRHRCCCQQVWLVAENLSLQADM